MSARFNIDATLNFVESTIARLRRSDPHASEELAEHLHRLAAATKGNEPGARQALEAARYVLNEKTASARRHLEELEEISVQLKRDFADLDSSRPAAAAVTDTQTEAR